MSKDLYEKMTVMELFEHLGLKGCLSNSKGFGPIPHWIDCKDKLPDETLINRYICLLINNHICVGSVSRVYVNYIYSSIPEFSISTNEWIMPKFYAKPTHWCLLPEIENNLIDKNNKYE